MFVRAAVRAISAMITAHDLACQSCSRVLLLGCRQMVCGLLRRIKTRGGWSAARMADLLVAEELDSVKE